MDIYIAQKDGEFRFWTFKKGRIIEIDSEVAMTSPNVQKAVEEMQDARS